ALGAGPPRYDHGLGPPRGEQLARDPDLDRPAGLYRTRRIAVWLDARAHRVRDCPAQPPGGIPAAGADAAAGLWHAEAAADAAGAAGGHGPGPAGPGQRPGARFPGAPA